MPGTTLSAAVGTTIAATFATLPLLTHAATPSFPHQQWVCKANDQGQWQCEQQESLGSFPKLALPYIRSGKQVAQSSQTKQAGANRNNPYQLWDWIAKGQMEDPSACKTGCNGSYQAPEPQWPDADQDPDTAPLRASAGSSDVAGDVITLSDQVLISQGNRALSTNGAVLDLSLIHI